MREEIGSSLPIHSELSTEGIRRAIEALSYRNHHSPKYRLVDALLRIHCRQMENGGPQGVANDDLIRLLWNTDDQDGVLISRRRNLSSLRSSVNSDLMAKYRSSENPEGVIIAPDNAFSICDEAKDEALKALRSMSGLGQGPLDMNRIGEVLQDIRALLTGVDESNDKIGSESEKAARDHLREVIRELAGQVGIRLVEGPGDSDLPPGGPREEAGDSGSGPDVEEVLEIVESEDGVEDPDLDEAEPEDVVDDLEVVAGLDTEIVDGEVEGPPENAEEETALDMEEVLEEVEAEDGVEDPDLDEAEPEDAVDDLEVVDGLDTEIVDEEVEETSEEAEEATLDMEEVLEEVAPDLDEAEPEDAVDDLEVVDGLGSDGEEAETDEAWALEDRLEGWEGLGNAGEGPLNPEKARVLAEEFNRSLAAMDQFYNQYILVSGEGDGPALFKPENGEPGGARVPMTDFYIGQFPVTNALFEVFVEKTGYRTTAERTGWGMVYQGRYRREINEQNGRKSLQVRSGIACTRVEGACWYQPWGPGSTLRNRRNHPVVQVSLEDAVAFAAWTGKRLPTEEEWEAAMRTRKGYGFPWGNDWKNDACNVEESCIGDTTAVDQYAAFANELGVADGLGNVIEWTLTRGSGPDDNRRAAKGASWIAGNGITLGGRTLLELDARSNILGFRCVAV